MKKIISAVAAVIMAMSIALVAAAPASANEEPLRLPAPVQTGCGADSIDVPEVEGVTYGVYDYTGTDGSGWLANPEWNYGWEPGDDIVVIASYSNWSAFGDDPIAPEGDYALDSSGNPGWWFTNTCTVVQAQVPVWTDPSTGNTTDGYWTAPEQEGVAYKVTRYSSGKVKIVASAQPGYVLVGTTQWQRIDR